MNTKLTLSLEKRSHRTGTIYAKKTGRSLSELVESYFKNLTEKTEKEDDIHPKVKKLIGRITLPDDFDEDKAKDEYFKEEIWYFNQIFRHQYFSRYCRQQKTFFQRCHQIFDYCQRKKIKMYSTSISIANLHYIAKKMVDEKELPVIY